MADKAENLLMKYKMGGSSYPPLQKAPAPPPVIDNDNIYQAVIDTKRGNRLSRFKIVTSGVSYGCSYAHLIDWVYTYPNEIILTTSSRIFTIEGRNLDKIERLLMEERIKEIHVFDETKYPMVGTKDDNPFIKAIRVE